MRIYGDDKLYSVTMRWNVGIAGLKISSAIQRLSWVMAVSGALRQPAMGERDERCGFPAGKPYNIE